MIGQMQKVKRIDIFWIYVTSREPLRRQTGTDNFIRVGEGVEVPVRSTIYTKLMKTILDEMEIGI